MPSDLIGCEMTPRHQAGVVQYLRSLPADVLSYFGVISARVLLCYDNALVDSLVRSITCPRDIRDRDSGQSPLPGLHQRLVLHLDDAQAVDVLPPLLWMLDASRQRVNSQWLISTLRLIPITLPLPTP